VNPTRLVMPSAAPTFGNVRLRAFEERDVGMVTDLSTDPYVPQIGSLPGNASSEEALAYIERQISRLDTGAGYSLCVADNDTDEALGTAGLWLASIAAGRATAGYSVAPRYRGRGIAGQALTALTRFAWSLPELHRIELYIEPWNVASVRTAELAGYKREGLLRSHQEIGGRRVDMLLYATIRGSDQVPHEDRRDAGRLRGALDGDGHDDRELDSTLHLGDRVERGAGADLAANRDRQREARPVRRADHRQGRSTSDVTSCSRA
jgi:ribosomal-protein-alanine N-acetyltransferase